MDDAHGIEVKAGRWGSARYREITNLDEADALESQVLEVEGIASGQLRVEWKGFAHIIGENGLPAGAAF